MLILLVFVAGGFYVFATWHNYVTEAREEAISLAASAASFIEPEQIRGLKASAEDLNSPHYIAIKKELIDFRETNKHVRFAYLFVKKDGKFLFLADSEMPESADYSPPGQIYEEATETLNKTFLSGQSQLGKPVEDRWGRWVSALVPVIDPDSGEVFAVFGIDYPAEYWYDKIRLEVMHALVVTTGILLLLLLLYRVTRTKYRLDETAKELSKSEALFRTVFEQSPVGIALIDAEYYLSDMNSQLLRIIDGKKEEMISTDWRNLLHPEDLEATLEIFRDFKEGKRDKCAGENRLLLPNGEERWISLTMVALKVDGLEELEEEPIHLCMMEDIQERKDAEQTLEESERSKRFLLENLPGMAYRCKYDREWTMEFVSKGCFDLTGYREESLINNNELSFNDLISPEFQQVIWDEWSRAIKLRLPFRYEYEIVSASGEHKWVLETGQGVYEDGGKIKALEGIIIDITELKKRQNQILYINDHDFLTGLYNRHYYEMQKKRLEWECEAPVSILVADINGVRLTNDAFGSIAGDRLIIEAAKIMQSCCREGDVLARAGGDEFSLILPDTDRKQAYGILNDIKIACEKANAASHTENQPVSLSMGFGTKDDSAGNLEGAEKEAAEYLRRSKLFAQKSIHNSMLSSIMATMYARSQETEEHSRRISDMCIRIAEKIGLPKGQQQELHLFAMLHDIGKVGIDDRILNKPEGLDEKEWGIMKMHSEIGYRIVMSSPDLSGVADYILAHHERWDGKGYPLGLEGENIPLLSRILAVADSYDAMTAGRIYREALPHEMALQEILKNAGSQFDEEIVHAFTEIIDEYLSQGYEGAKE